MRFLSTRINANEIQKHKVKGKLCCKAQEQRQIRLLSTRTSVNDVAKHRNKRKMGKETYEQRQLRFLSTQTRINEDRKLKKNPNEVHQHKINGKRG